MSTQLDLLGLLLIGAHIMSIKFSFIFETRVQATNLEKAFSQEEIDKSIYSKMADDLETVNKRIKKKKSKKIGQNPSAISA